MDDLEKIDEEEGKLDKEFVKKLKKNLQEKEELMRNRKKHGNNFTYFITIGIVVLLCSLMLGIYFINKSRDNNSNSYSIEEVNI